MAVRETVGEMLRRKGICWRCAGPAIPGSAVCLPCCAEMKYYPSETEGG